MDVQLNAMIPQKMQNGMVTFRGPILSEKKFGTMRPNTEPVFRIVRR